MATGSVIRVLSEETIHKIAAGEVVERPASVVKELVENSLDARADQINVVLINGGKRLIRVADNGCGMNSQDALLAVERHATSKLNSSNDLERIATFGFRGEALATVSAVSRMKLATNTPDGVAGTQIIIEGGTIKRVTDVGAPPGTVIEVRNLFYNVPARLKFLKSSDKEQSYISRILSQQSLSHPGVHFTLRAAGRTIFELPPVTELPPRLAALYGSDVASGLLSLDYHSEDIHLQGYISNPKLHRSNTEYQSNFVNQRLVKDKFISGAVYEAYRRLLPKGRHPIWVLFLEIPYEAVDVNVHPAKLEVRFRRSKEIRHSILSAVQQTLTDALSAASVFSAPLSHPSPSAGDEGQAPQPRATTGDYKPLGDHNENEVDADRTGAPGSKTPYRERIKGAVEAYFEKTTPPSPSTPSAGQPHSQEPLPGKARAALTPLTGDTKPIRIEEHPAPPADQQFFASLEPVGQIDASFIVCQNSSELVIIDQHAAHERVRYEALRRRYNTPPSEETKSDSYGVQRLLFPIVLELSFKEAAILEEQAEVFAELGFEIAALGGRTFALQAAPGDLEPGGLGRIIQDILDGLGKEAAISPAELRDELLKQMACHSAIKANQQLKPEEIRHLLRELAQLQCPPCCPHGRPYILRYRLADLRKHFLRKTTTGKHKGSMELDYR